MASSVTVRPYLLVTIIVCTVFFSCILGEDSDYEPQIGAIGKQPDGGHEGGDEDQGHQGGVEDHSHEIGDEGGGEDHGHGVGGEEGGEGHGHGVGGEEGGEGHGVGGEEGGKGHGVGGEEGGEGHGVGGEEGGEGHGHEGEGGDAEGGAVRGNDPAHIADGALLCFHEKHIYSSCDESCRLTAEGELHVPPERVDEFCSGPCLEESNLVLDCLDGIMEHFLFFNKATTQDVRDTILAGCSHGEHRGDFDVEPDEGGGSIGREPTFLILSGILIMIIMQVLL